MVYDDIRKELELWTDFLRHIKKDVSSGQTRNYPNVLNGLMRLSDAIRSLERALDEQEDKTIRRRCDDAKKSVKELQDIISDSMGKHNSWVKVNNRLIDLVEDFDALSELLEEGVSETTGGKAGDADKPAKTKQNIYAKITAFFWKGYEITIKAAFDAILNKQNPS